MNARTFALIYGIVFLAVGILGFGIVPGVLADQTGSGLQVSGMLLGKFHVNGLHNIIHILFGLWGLAASRSLGGAVGYFKVVTVIYLLLAILGLIAATATGFGYVMLGGYNVYLHAALGIVAAYFGFVKKG
jgi:hypothetical protein